MLSAAVVNKTFRNLLLSDADRALGEGYLGEDFGLKYQERELILSIEADSLPEFARQVCAGQALQRAWSSGSWVPARESALVLDAE